MTTFTSHDHQHQHQTEFDYFFFFFLWHSQLQREPLPFPTLKIKRDVPDIDSFKFEDFEIIGYKPHPTIKMKMAV